MLKLGEFIGQLTADMARARQIADANSAAISQSYHADSFLKRLPVPHYTIEQATVTVPVIVENAITEAAEKGEMTEAIVKSMKKKLPGILQEQMKLYYFREKDAAIRRQADMEDTAVGTADSGAEDKENKNFLAKAIALRPSRDMVRKFGGLAQSITQSVVKSMEEYLKTVNFQQVKSLDIKDNFNKLLKGAIAEEMQKSGGEKLPFKNEEWLEAFAEEVSTKIFFEFDAGFVCNHGIAVNVNTGKINEYAVADSIMHLSITIREQDFEVLVEGNGEEESQRVLALN